MIKDDPFPIIEVKKESLNDQNIISLNTKVNLVYKVECDKIMVYILYDKIGDKFITNSEAKDIFINKLKFKWFCVVRDEKLNQRYIQ